MKYWNKNKRVRERCWTQVPRQSLRLEHNQRIKRWCHDYPSKGRFYIDYSDLSIWFEFEQDATWFKLTWS